MPQALCKVLKFGVEKNLPSSPEAAGHGRMPWGMVCSHQLGVIQSSALRVLNWDKGF